MKIPYRFIHITFELVQPTAALEKTFSAAHDWIRVNSHMWILYSNTDLDTWRDRIRRTPGIIMESNGFFLSEFEAGKYSGYQNDATWAWLSRSR